MKFIPFPRPGAVVLAIDQQHLLRLATKTIIVMKLTLMILTASLCAVASESRSQSITFTAKNASPEEVMAAVKQQAKLVFIYKQELLANAHKISVVAKDMPVQEFLSRVFDDQPFTWFIENQTVVLKRSNDRSKRIFDELVKSVRIVIKGTVTGPNNRPLAGATVRIRETGAVGVTDENGHFEILGEDASILEITYVGFAVKTVKVKGNEPLVIELTPLETTLESVNVTFNTGYQSVPKERATGSFTLIDSALFNRATGGNILSRLEGVTNGLVMNRQGLRGENVAGQPTLRVRGLSTILGATSPLIIVNNFPFEGDLNTINPNDVESITVLRDAAAASIWGARAGNGVIVVTTKTGKYNQPVRISLNSNVIVGDKPDLFYSKDYLPASQVMDAQKEFFLNNGYIIGTLYNIPMYVELLVKRRDGRITEEQFLAQEAKYRQSDIRYDFSKYLYQKPVIQQNSLGVQGGGNNYKYAFSVNYDKTRDMYVGNSSNRLGLSLQNTYKIRPNLELTGQIWFTNQKKENNAFLSSTTQLTGNKFDIYERLVDDNGKPAPLNSAMYRFDFMENAPVNMPNLKLVDWMLRPIEEVNLNDNKSEQNDYRLQGGLKYRFLKYFNLDVTYMFTQSRTEQETYHQKESFYVRDLVNQFTQPNGNRVIPYGGIMEYSGPVNNKTQSGRALMNYSQRFGRDHDVTAIAAFEMRQTTNLRSFGQSLYNFNRDLWTGSAIYDFSTNYQTLPGSFMRIPTRATALPSKIVNRDLSYFGNASYTYKERYIVSGSIRWDGSNLLGVRANQRGTSLWSGGLSWDISKEHFYGLQQWLPYLRLRATYGSAGNIDRSQTSMPVMNIVTNTVTGLQTGVLINAGNPSLRWEQVNTMNFGADWRALKDRISGSVEFYRKDAKYLLGSNSVDPTTGVPSSFKLNYAALRTWGWDIQIRSRNLEIGDFVWTTNLLINTSNNKVMKIKENPPANDNSYLFSSLVEQGKSVDRIYAIPWNGLNPQDGSVLIYDKSGAVRKDYNTYYQNVKKNEFLYAGLTSPPLTGSIMNTFEWKGLSVSAVITGKFNYVFRRTSMMPGAEYGTVSMTYHVDYFNRWKKPGDEKFTNVPAKVPVTGLNTDNTAMANIYRYSEALITPADQIRLQDVNISYGIPWKAMKGWPVKSIRVYGYARNLGLIWRKNDVGIDPEYPLTLYPEPKSYSAGLQVEF